MNEPQPHAPKLGVTTSRILATRKPLTTWIGMKGGEPVTLTVCDASAPEQARARFLIGARAIAKLGEGALASRLLPVTELDEGECAFTSGVAATQCLTEVPSLEWALDRKLDCFRSIAGAIAALHAAKLAHGCLCPANILLDAELKPLVSEAGMVSLAREGDRGPYEPYAAPEALKGERPVATTDIFGLGRVLAFLLMGKEPVAETDEIPRLEALAESVHAGLVRITRKCTALDPETRYNSVAALLSDLDKFGAFGSVGIGHPQVLDKKLGDADTKLGAGMSRPPKARYVPPAEPRRSLAPPVAFTPPAKSSSGPRLPGRALMAGGVALFVAGSTLAYLGVVGVTPASMLAGLGAAVAGFGLPPISRSPIASRVAWALALITLTVLGAPVARLAALGDTHRLRHADPDTRVKAVRAGIASGQRDLSDALLADADLTGIDLSNADMRRADLSRANLTNTCLIGANLDGAKLANAKLIGTNMAGASLSFAIDFESAECDAKTRLPSGWTCTANHLAKAQ